MTPNKQQQAAIDAATARLGGGVTTPGGQTFSAEQLQIMEQASQRLQAKSYDVIKTLPDGSQVLQFNDGSMQVLNQEAGLASKDPDIVNAAMRGESPVEASKRKRAGEILSQGGPSLSLTGATAAEKGARGATFLKGVPFIGSYADEILGQTPREQAQIRGLQSALATAKPGEALSTQIAGGVQGGGLIGAVSGPLGGAALIDKLSKLPRAGKYLSYLGLGSALGGGEGAIYGYGEGGPEKAKELGILGAITGGATSVALPAIGNTLATGFANFKTTMGRKDLTNIARELGVSEDTAKVIQSVVQQGDADLADMLAAIDRAGEQGMIADADIATQVLLDAAAAAEGGAASIARTAVESRAKEAGQQLEQTLDTTIQPKPLTATGETADVQDIASAISAETRPQRQAAYNKAYNTPVPYDKPAGRRIESLIGRIPPTLMRRAIQEANDEMRVNQVGAKQIMADIDADGNVTFIEMPNTVQLDYIKRALGTLGNEKDQFNRPTADAGRAQTLYTELSSALADAVPSYRQATRLGGDKIGRDRALQVGEEALKTNVTTRDVVRQLANLDEGQRLYARVGLRDSIERTINNVKATINSPDLDINELRTVLRELSSESNRSKVRAIIGNDNANKLFRELEKANAALQLRAAVAVNSKTAIRQSMKESIEALTEPGAIQTAMQGEPFRAAQQLTKAISGAGTEYTEAQKGTIMKEIARAMTQARGEEAKRQLKVIYNAVKENRATQEQMQQASDFLINSITLPATMFGTAAATRD